MSPAEAEVLSVAIIADDLTGAMDAAAPFAQRGLTTCVLSDPDALDGSVARRCKVVALTTESRHAEPAAAAAAVRAAILRLERRRPALVFKKIDSTLRGNVSVEVVAAMEAVNALLLVIAPAVPTQGRTVRCGAVYVHGVPLQDAPIGRDAMSAPPSETLGALLRTLRAGLTVIDVPRTDPLPLCGLTLPAALIIDCEQQSDFDRVAHALSPPKQQTLLVGARGFAEALAEQHYGAARTLPAQLQGTARLLYVVGSRTPESTLQAQRMILTRGALLLAAPGGYLDTEAAAAKVLHSPDAPVVLQAQPAATSYPASEVAHRIGQLAAELLSRCAFQGLVVTGGDTARALLAALEASAIEVLGEILPGVALGRIDCNGRQITLVTKAGGFGGEDLFAQISKLLREPSAGPAASRSKRHPVRR
jgi:D-threonate/D-erythronate kinase